MSVHIYFNNLEESDVNYSWISLEGRLYNALSNVEYENLLTTSGKRHVRVSNEIIIIASF